MPTPRRYANRAQQQTAYRQRQAQARQAEMQAKGLPPLPAIATMPGRPRWRAMIQQALLLLEAVQKEMDDYAQQRSDAWQESERAESFAERQQAVEEALDALQALQE
jgi:hypothetical protein